MTPTDPILDALITAWGTAHEVALDLERRCNLALTHGIAGGLILARNRAEDAELEASRAFLAAYRAAPPTGLRQVGPVPPEVNLPEDYLSTMSWDLGTGEHDGKRAEGQEEAG